MICMQNSISSYEMDGVIETGGGRMLLRMHSENSISSYVMDGVIVLQILRSTCDFHGRIHLI